jgi:hypothetical protein
MKPSNSIKQNVAGLTGYSSDRTESKLSLNSNDPEKSSALSKSISTPAWLEWVIIFMLSITFLILSGYSTSTEAANDDYFFLRLGLQKTHFNSDDEFFERMEDSTQAHVTAGWVKPIGKNFYFDFTIGHESYPGLGHQFNGNGDSELVQNWYGVGLEYRLY